MVMAKGKVRYQLYLTKEASERFELFMLRPGYSKSETLSRALTDWINRQGHNPGEEMFGNRLDRMSKQLARIERDGHVALESLALFVLYQLTVTAPLPEGDSAARAVGRERFDAFIARVGRAMSTGKRTLSPPAEGTGA